jgi:hypothetical protein
MMERLQLFQRLERVMEETEFGWSLLMVGEDQSRKLADLTNDLKRPYSTTGDGKQILSGYSYWGIEPAIAWRHACHDPYYPVGKDGIDSFAQRWNHLQPSPTRSTTMSASAQAQETRTGQCCRPRSRHTPRCFTSRWT